MWPTFCVCIYIYRRLCKTKKVRKLVLVVRILPEIRRLRENFWYFFVLENIRADPDWYFFARAWGPNKDMPRARPEKAADLQQSKPVKAEKSSPARKATAKAPVEGQHKEPAEGKDQEVAEGHNQQKKEESQPAPSQSAWKDM